MQLSVCIITRNEEQNIARCLQCLLPYDFEIVVADTGSTDRTREVAAQYTDKLYDFSWCDDFAAAKNFAISKATNAYVLVLDSDEFLEPLAVDALYAQIKKHPAEVGRIRRKNVFSRNGQEQENTEWINRIFPKERFCYEGRIHEQVTAVDGSAYETYQTNIVIEHRGYDLTEEQRKEKANRNIVLLERELEQIIREGKTADDRTPYVYYQLGKSYYMAGEYDKASGYFSEGLSYDLNPKLEYVIDMVETYGYALLNSGRAETALLFESIYEAFGDSADFQFLMGLIYMNNSRFDDAVREFEKATKHCECRMKGVNSYLAFYNIGVIYECLGEKERARAAYEKCGSYEPAVRQKQALDVQ